MSFKLSSVEIEKLINITVQVMMQNFMKDLTHVKITRSKERTNVWNEICFQYFGCIEYKKVLLLFQWWCRDTNSYSSLTKKILCELNDASNEQMEVCNNKKKIIITLTQNEWESVSQFIASYNNRQKFKSEFSNYLSEKIQENGIKCWLKCDFNWFRKPSSQKWSSPFWNGRYKCIECKNEFKTVIHEESLDAERKKYVLVFIEYEEQMTHNEKIFGRMRCVGEKRLQQAKDLMIDGTCNTVSNNIINNSINQSIFDKKVTNEFVLNNIKCEYKNRNKLSNDVFRDASTTKLITDAFFPSNFLIKGYIHEIGLNPFGFLLISDFQLSMWKSVQEQMPILFFDATGSIHKKIDFQKTPFLYSLVFHDTKKHKIIPLAEFISTSNDQISIAKYLTSFKNILEQNKIELPKIIVTDMSWALINSVLLVFNNSNISNYLNFCYTFLKNDKTELNRVMKVKYYLCSTHFFKNIKKKAKNVNVNKDARTVFLFAFVLIQNTITIEQIDIYLKHIHNLFCNPFFDDSVAESLKFLHRQIKNKKLDDFDLEDERQLPEQMRRDQDFECFVKESTINIECNYENSIKANSPFSKFYDKKIIQYTVEVTNKMEMNKIKNIKSNIFYSNDLFQILWDQLYIIPIWSGLMIKDQLISYNIKTRLSNNAVEDHFSIVKNRLLNKNKNISTSEIVTAFFKYIYSRYLKFYDLDKSNQNKYIPIQEIWTDKNQKPKRNEKFYFNNFDIFKLIGVQQTIQMDQKQKGNDQMDYEQMEQDQLDNGQMEQDQLDNERMEQDQMIKETSIIQDLNKLKKIKNLLKIIEQKSISFGSIKKKFDECKNILNEFIFLIKNIQKFTEYDGQPVYNSYKEELKLEKHFYPIYNSPNGNCLYNSISILLFGTEDFYYLIKFENFIIKTCKRSEFGETLNILSISMLLNKTLYCFVQSKKWSSNVKHIYSLRTNDYPKVLIGCFKEHFFPILTNEKSFNFKECIDLNNFNFDDRFIDFENINE